MGSLRQEMGWMAQSVSRFTVKASVKIWCYQYAEFALIFCWCVLVVAVRKTS